MLAYKFDVPIQVDSIWTVISAVLAVSFTFVAISGESLYHKWRHGRRGRRSTNRYRAQSRRKAQHHLYKDGPDEGAASAPLLTTAAIDEEAIEHTDFALASELEQSQPVISVAAFDGSAANGKHATITSNGTSSRQDDTEHVILDDFDEDTTASTFSISRRASEASSISRRMSGTESTSSFGLKNMIGLVRPNFTRPEDNIFHSTRNRLYVGFTYGNLLRGFTWSVAIFAMHYTGIWSLNIPNGYFEFNTGLVILSGLIAWIVCTVGFILMSQMETYLPQQLIFSVVATSGVASMHWCGMLATTFWTTMPPTDNQGFPKALISAVVAVAFVTCMIANVLLSHSATMSRNKLAEIVWTRKQLFKNIAAKEHAEAAARARSEFITSASHEIRTPLHHLQGYSDLLSQTDLTDEGRTLLTAIQRACKTLNLLCNNVLDWSKFEGNANGQYLPAPVDVRVVCDSIITLLPNLEDDHSVEILVVVSPEVPKTLKLDESWIHRILMNLLSNALKFTKQGYILLLLEMKEDDLVATVSDTGCGLSPSFIPEMWSPFKQGEVQGSARGTGLGLSIVQMLLHRMKGSIEVESQYEGTEGVGPERSGTKFTATIPVETVQDESVSSLESRATLLEPRSQVDVSSKVAILCAEGRSSEGLTIAWRTFGCDVQQFSSITELEATTSKFMYIWAELDFLKINRASWPQLLKRDDFLILIPYDTRDADTLDLLPGVLKATNVVLLQKPLLWHTFAKRVQTSRERRRSEAPSKASKALRFAADVQVLNGDNPSGSGSSGTLASAKKHEYTILLVEDNPLNRRLGVKMLHNLSYKTLLANDGLEALTMIVKHDAEIDCVLMDQSMPNLSGVEATRGIRDMEKQGKIRAGRPILAVTAVVNNESRDDFQQAGADDFLPKPLSLETLRDRLRSWLPDR